MSKIEESSRIQDPQNPQITFVQRVKNGEFQHVKEITSTTGESAVVDNQTIETITITRQITAVTSY